MKPNTNTVASHTSRTLKQRKVTRENQEAIQILIRTEGVELTDELKRAIIRKIGRVRQYSPRALRARVQLHKVAPNRSARQFRARVHYEIPGNDLVAEHNAHEALAAIDLVAEKIERRLRRRKTARLAGRVREYRAQAHRSPASVSA